MTLGLFFLAVWPGRFSRLLKKVEIRASSFDRLRMRLSDFSGLDLMVSLSNHGPHLFQRPVS